MSGPPGTEDRARTEAKRALLVERLHRQMADERWLRPLSFAQQRLWFLDQIEPGSAVYNLAQAYRLRGELDPAALEGALGDLAARHAVLRTTFATVDGRALQRVSPESSWALHREDLSLLPPEDREKAARSRATEEAERRFDLAQGPLCRAHLLRIENADHLLVLTLHHAVADGWSMSILQHELGVLYAARLRGDVASLPPPPIQYGDFSVWQRESLQGERLEAPLAYWRQRLSEAATLQLPGDRSRPPAQTFRGRRTRVALGRELSEGLRVLARAEGATLFMVLLAAFQALLSRWSGQTDVVVGSAIAGRNRKELEGLVGFFVNSLVLRTDLSGDPPMREVLARARETALGAYAHQELPFERLVDELQPERSLDRNPLFQVVLALQNTPSRPLELPGLSVTRVELERTLSKLDLTLSLEDGPAGLSGFLEYSLDLFEASTVERLLRHYERVLRSFVSKPEARVSEVTLLTEGERRQVVVEWNATKGPYPEMGIGEVFTEVAGRSPGKVAVRCGEESLPYGDLEALSNQLARVLAKVGVKVGSRVGICVERSSDLAVGLLGIVKAGGAYVPLDPSYPKERLEYLVRDAEIAVLVTQESLLGLLPEVSTLFCLDREKDALGREPMIPFGVEVGPDDLAYVTYTSGSTGWPKGVEVRHRGVMRLLFSSGYAEFGPEQVFLQLAPVTFDASTLEIWGALLHGGRLVLYPGRVPAAAALGEVLKGEGVTTLWLTSSLYNAVVDEAAEALSSVKQLLIGGEALSVAHVRKGLERLPSTRIINGYGPTESTTFACCYEIPRDLGEVKSISIGRPIGNTRVYVLDGRMEPVPVGVLGELYVGGDGLARGYLKRAELTAEKFLPDPFAEIGGERLYRTGDLARYSPDGHIEFAGRVDEQVKVRGYRIELSEIESVLGRHEAVVEAVVIVRPEPRGAKTLVAFVVAREGIVDLRRALRCHLQSRLPEYMAPRAIEILEALPRTPNGKVDREALSRRVLSEDGRVDTSKGARAPTDAEARLATLWTEVLGVEEIGPDDNFFELGGDSILSIQLCARANKAGLRITPKQLFQAQTLAGLAAIAGKLEERASARGAVAGPLPMTPIQRWFFERFSSHPNHFNQWVLLDAAVRLDQRHLETTLRALEQVHEALRFRFVREGGKWRQSAGGVPETVLEVADLRELAKEAQDSALAERADRLHRSLDLPRGPLWRALLVLRGSGRPDQLLLLAHHLVVDGVSWRILIEDLQTAYRQVTRGEPVALDPEGTSFAEWALRLDEHARREEVASEEAFWIAQAAEGPPALLPLDEPQGRERNDFSSARRVSTVLSEAETAAILRDVPRAYGLHADETLLAAAAPVLARFTHSPSILVDLERHGREEIADGLDLTRTVGWFTALFPVRLRVDGIETARDALVSIKEQMRRVPEHGLGYGLLRYGAATPAAAAAFGDELRAEISFNYLGQFDQGEGADARFRLAEGSGGLGASAEGPRPHLLGLSARVSGGCLALDWTYCKHAHRQETVEALAGETLRALRALIRHCQGPGAGGHTPSDFPLARLDQSRLDRLLGAEKGIESVYPLSPMQQGMLFHARLAPESIAHFVQMTQLLEGPLDEASYRTAWRQTAARHAVLRTSFAWEGLEEPLQIVRREANVPFEQHDWNALVPAEQEQQFQAFLAGDRQRRFDLGTAPVWRITLIRLALNLHRVVWSLHHILLDGWSLPLVLNEVFGRYEALIRGETRALAAAPPYERAIAWLGRQDRDAAEAFWRRALGGVTAPVSLPIDPPRDVPQAESYEEKEVVVGPKLTETLQALARRGQVTLNTILQGAWALLLARCCGTEDVIFGTTVSGRSAELADVESMVGVFINTLPVRAQVPPEAPVGTWLRQLHTSQLEMLQHQWSPLVDVQRWSEMPEGAPLFESLLLFENYPAVDSLWRHEGALRVREIRGEGESSYPLTLVVVPRDGLSIRLKYDLRRYGARDAERMLGFYVRLLEGLAANPEARLAEISLLDDKERRRVLVEWNRTASDYPRWATLPELFTAQAARMPGAVATAFGGEVSTYAELDRRSNQLARHLRDLGVRLESRVGLCVERSSAMVAGMLGILKAGGAYVPLDPGYPRERLEYMLRDARIEVVVTQPDLAVAFAGVRTVSLGGQTSDVARQSEEPLRPDSAPDALAYVIYTSGSTGNPKGVGVTHRAVARLVLNTNYIELGPEDVVAQASSSSFDAATFEVWGALLHGARLQGIGREVAVSPREFAAELQERGVTVLFLTTALFNLVASEAPGAFRSLRTLLFGGEAVDPRWVRSVRAEGPPERLLHVYGPTETTTFATWHLVGDVPEGASVPIGRPLSNTTAFVLGGNLEPRPVSLPGELYLGGEGVARGYLDRPDLTAERFIPDPFGTEPGARLYRTGDLVRQDAEGAIEFLGRVDNQVKLRGFRIELGEIEAALRRQASVKDAAVLLREDEPGVRRLVAYAVFKDEGEAGRLKDLRRQLLAELPEHMVPAAFVELPALPLNANGKVDRPALPTPDPRRAGLEGAHVAPRNPTEEILAGIFADVLGVERVGILDDFFALGGHSLLVTRVASRVREAFGVELPLRRLFEAPTVAEGAAEVDALLAAGGPRLPDLRPRPPEQRRLPSFAQQRLWFLEQLEPGRGTYVLPAFYRIEGALDASALEKAWLQLQRRHESLRTSFVAEEGRPLVRIAPEPQAGLTVVDMSSLPREEREAASERLRAEQATGPFDLAKGPVLRATLARLSDTEHQLLLAVHHIASDGWSIGVLESELGALYEAFVLGCSPSLQPLPVQYQDFALWQREWLAGDPFDRQIAYWRARLEGAPRECTLPRTSPLPAATGPRSGGRLSRLVAPRLAREVEVLSRREGVTLFMVLLAAFKCVLARHSGQTDVVVGTPIAGRTRTEVEGLVGFFVNTLVLRSDLSGNPSFRELLKRVRQAALEGYAHQDLPFERLVEELEPQREAGRNPLFQVMFNLVEFDRAGLRFADLTVSRLRNPEPESKFDLTLYAAPSSEGIELVAVYDAASYSAQHIDEVLVQLELLLEQAVAQPDLRVGQYSLLSPRAERVLAEPGTSLDRGWHGSVTERFSIQAAEHPDRVAIADAVREWTYRELETASNRLAHYLRDEGIRPGDVVALHAHRGGTVVWALLGVMKAGAAFLVLDSAYPAAALRERLRQARPRAFVDCGDGTGQSDLLDGWEEAPRLRVDLPRDPTQTGAWSSKPAVPPQGVVEPDQLAYVAFTSGSSGGAKGILGTQRPLSHFFEWHTRHFDLVAVDRFSLLSGLSHDPFLRDVFTPLWLGATLCIPDAMDLAQGRLGDWMAAQRVTVAHLTPSLARLLEGSGSDGLASLRYVFFGGETLRYSDVARLHAVAGGATCVNYYGATETPQAMGFFVVPPSPGVAETAARSECVPLGRGIGAVRLLVLNGVGQRAGLGEIGEIHVQTPYLAVGYLGDETQTRERFVRDPFQPTTGERLYRTGDLGRYTLEGDVVFTGRADDQVKIRGVRVEPAEVEAALLQHPQLAQAAVTAHDPAPGDSRLVAYVVSRGERAPEADVLRSFLADRLPQGMIPTSIVALTALPLTPNGKLDRRALPPPNGHGHGHGRPSYVAPRSPVEQELASLWTDLLEIPDVGVHDDFFALGGHSLLGTQLVSRVRDLLGVEIPLRALFENPTLADLAAAVTQIFLETADETEREPLAAGLGDEDKVAEESNL